MQIVGQKKIIKQPIRQRVLSPEQMEILKKQPSNVTSYIRAFTNSVFHNQIAIKEKVLHKKISESKVGLFSNEKFENFDEDSKQRELRKIKHDMNQRSKSVGLDTGIHLIPDDEKMINSAFQKSFRKINNGKSYSKTFSKKTYNIHLLNKPTSQHLERHHKRVMSAKGVGEHHHVIFDFEASKKVMKISYFDQKHKNEKSMKSNYRESSRSTKMMLGSSRSICSNINKDMAFSIKGKCPQIDLNTKVEEIQNPNIFEARGVNYKLLASSIEGISCLSGKRKETKNKSRFRLKNFLD